MTGRPTTYRYIDLTRCHDASSFLLLWALVVSLPMFDRFLIVFLSLLGPQESFVPYRGSTAVLGLDGPGVEIRTQA